LSLSSLCDMSNVTLKGTVRASFIPFHSISYTVVMISLYLTDKSSDMHSGKSRSEIDSICNDAVARSNSEAPCTTRLSLRLHYTAPDKSSSRHDFQPRPEIDSNGYATVRDYCHDTRKTNLELPATTEITPMARKLATPNRERIQVSKRFALPNSTDVTSDSQQYEDMRL
jgi:hypothetical protein